MITNNRKHFSRQEVFMTKIAVISLILVLFLPALICAEQLTEQVKVAGPFIPAAAPIASRAFSTPIQNFAGSTSTSSPPDNTGDVGPNHFVQATNDASSTSNSPVSLWRQ